jgi:8-oxo-dGTP pyrophosphatase MutT (NUDIX family)
MMSSSVPISSQDFMTRALTQLLGAPAPEAFDPDFMPPHGDHRLADMLAPVDGRLHRPAAVLIPVIARPDGATVLLTRRAEHLKDHAGQIAFPGGKMDASDAAPLDTALREAEEEIGLARRFVEPIGYLDPYLSSTGFRIMPVVAMIDPAHHLRIDPSEVESAFEVPLGFLMDPARHETHEREWRGMMRRYYAMPYGDYYIWGVTAGILRNLYEKVYGA